MPKTKKKKTGPLRGQNSLSQTQIAAFVIAFCVLGMAFVVSSFAASGGGKGGHTSGSGSISVAMVTDANGNGLPNYGDSIKFNVSTTATAEPHVSLKCYQNGSTLVYTSQTGYYPSYPWPDTNIFSLTSGAWTGGSANCSAVGYYFNGTKTVTFATLNFVVGS